MASQRDIYVPEMCPWQTNKSAANVRIVELASGVALTTSIT